MTTNNSANIPNVVSGLPVGVSSLTPQTASSSPSLVFAVGAVYARYLFSLDSIVEGTPDDKLYMYFSTNGGSTYLTDYAQIGVRTAQNDGPSRVGANNQSQISLTEDAGVNSTDGGYGYYGTVILFNNIGTQPRVQIESVWKGNSSTTLRTLTSSAYSSGTGSAITAVKFAFSTGNIASGTITPYAFN